MVTYLKDQHGETWKQDGCEGAYRRCSDKFRIDDLDTYNHTLHSVAARRSLKKNINKDRKAKLGC